MTDATKLAESLRAMRRNARPHWQPSPDKTLRHSIMMDSTRLGDLTDAADLIERQAAELAEWRSVFGHLGETPDDCGNVIGEVRAELESDAEFNRRRIGELQRWQSSMRDPERTIVCDILANGRTLEPQFAGDRYTVKEAPAVLLSASAADAVIDLMDWDLDLTEHADMRRLVRAAEAAALAANGKAVP